MVKPLKHFLEDVLLIKENAASDIKKQYDLTKRHL